VSLKCVKMRWRPGKGRGKGDGRRRKRRDGRGHKEGEGEERGRKGESISHILLSEPWQLRYNNEQNEYIYVSIYMYSPGIYFHE